MNTLYITVDGLTDHLGQSQILPYLRELRKDGHKITVLSCEKPAKLRAEGSIVNQTLRQCELQWKHVPFISGIPLLGPILNILNLWYQAIKLYHGLNFETIHARSYPSALIALWFKKRHGVKFLFDMRGFWPDEKVEGGSWNLNNPAYQAVYRFLKRKEREFFSLSDHIVSLTETGKSEILSWELPQVKADKISVIPCCCDLDRFSPQRVDRNARDQLREKLSLLGASRVFVYLGSLGTWYALDDMLEFFKRALKRDSNAVFLFLSSEPRKSIERVAESKDISISALRITRVSPGEVPVALSLADVGVIFIHPVYSKKGSSPTKLAELLAMGLPVVANSGVGDSKTLHDQYPIGPLVAEFTNEEYDRALGELDNFLQKPKSLYRETAESYFSLNRGANSYRSIYHSIDNTTRTKH